MPHKLYIKEEEKNDEWKHLPKKESSSKCEKVNIISYSTYADAAGADDPMLLWNAVLIVNNNLECK